jgi:dynein heavy chain
MKFFFFSFFDLLVFKTNYNRLSSGLAKLSDANAGVSVMRDELAVLGPQIDAKEKVYERNSDNYKRNFFV